MPENGWLWGSNVSEGGLEPPCPFGALAPQASASAYSATRTSACHGWCRASRLTIANPGGSGDGASAGGRGYHGRTAGEPRRSGRVNHGAMTWQALTAGSEPARRPRVQPCPHYPEPSPP